MRPLVLAALAFPALLSAQPLHRPHAFTYADTLRGSIGPYRAWWDVTHYDLTVKPDFATKSLKGTTYISFIARQQGERMQIDLQQPLEVDEAFFPGFADRPLRTEREDNVLWLSLGRTVEAGEHITIAITYHGVPRAARNPPWDGGWIWKTDPGGWPWMSVACQGLGASVWYPCKDTQTDEPDSAAVHLIVPDSLQAISNGRLRSTVKNADSTTTWTWAVTNPINNYDITAYIGRYAHIHEVYGGVLGPLDLDYWVLKENEAAARKQFEQVPDMLTCFERMFGPYPFYQDSYKLVEAPHLGMEHQSATAYGNHFQNGYLGRDLSGTGWGLKWDYVLVHESGHEWFGNSITTADIADMWVHEGFTMYSEVVFTECQSGRAAADEYVQGVRRNIANDKPIIGPYGVNQEGSSDMYYKGANLIHLIRVIMGDSLFKPLLLEMNKRFYHKVTTSAEVEQFISAFAHRDLGKVFDQYLRTTQIPELQWTVVKGDLFVRWADCVDGLTMPVLVDVNGEQRRIEVGTSWSWPASEVKKNAVLHVDPNWYVTSMRVEPNVLGRTEIDAAKKAHASRP